MSKHPAEHHSADALVMDWPDIPAEHDRLFGEGSWQELERDVRARNPLLFAVLDAQEEDEEEPVKRWWQFWL